MQKHHTMLTFFCGSIAKYCFRKRYSEYLRTADKHKRLDTQHYVEDILLSAEYS
ncbi:MAG: hypothetical protein ACJAYN_000665 [Bermanella sp.]|jgi:hypothetical protein